MAKAKCVDGRQSAELDNRQVALGRLRIIGLYCLPVSAGFRARSSQLSLPRLERAWTDTGETAKSSGKGLRALIADIERDGAHGNVGLGQTVRGLREPQPLDSFSDALARQRPIDAMEMIRRQMGNRRQAVHGVWRGWISENRLDDAGDSLTVITFGSRFHDSRRIAASRCTDVADLAVFARSVPVAHRWFPTGNAKRLDNATAQAEGFVVGNSGCYTCFRPP